MIPGVNWPSRRSPPRVRSVAEELRLLLERMPAGPRREAVEKLLCAPEAPREEVRT